MLKKMNLPNKLTLIRMLLVPVFIVFMALPTEWVWPLYVALAIFIIAAITDRFDGYLARKNNLITKFGKIMDPLADKLLVSAGFIMLVGLGVIPGWIIAVVIVRDFFVNGLRMFGADKEKDLAAGLSGKIKTIFQMIAIPFGILGVAIDAKYSAFGIFLKSSMLMSIFELFVNIFMTVSVVAVLLSTVWSFVDYLIRFKDDLKEDEDEEDDDEDETEESEDNDDEEEIEEISEDAEEEGENNEDEIEDTEDAQEVTEEVIDETNTEEIEDKKEVVSEVEEKTEEVKKENVSNSNSNKNKKHKNKNKK